MHGLNRKPSPGWTRRQALAGAGSAAALAMAAPGILRAQPKQIVMRTGGGKLEEAYRTSVYEPWKARTGIDVVTTSGEGAMLKAMVEQGSVEWDLMQGPAELLVVYAREGLLEPIDYSMIDRDSMLDGTAHEHFVLTDVAAYHVAWNTDHVTANPPQSWADLWAIDGRIGLWRRPFQTLEAALLADGVPLDELYPLDIERGLASLEKIRDSLVWWDSGAQGAQLLLDGEIDAGAIWNGRVHEPKLAGAPVDFHFEQAIFVSDAWGIPRGAPNKDAAMDMLAYSLSAESQAAFAELIPYAPVNTQALELLDEGTKAALPPADDRGVFLNLDYWADNGDQVAERFNTWILG